MLKLSLVLLNEMICSLIFLYSNLGAKLNVSPFKYIDEYDFNWGIFMQKL